MADPVCITVPVTCREGSASQILAPRLDAAGRVTLGPFTLSPHAAAQLALALYAVAAPLVDAEAGAGVADAELFTSLGDGEAA
ncbi:hypothetical protein [Plasticicumulans acidivorans]|uniref:Uncharacterized protein n=1 Tax=Plasticicumulans acidivorans TaxID=886464 RepID=A0A317N0P5_9GAMM|nr:hypothetical protein [Plasticicumulans acidivorans]PWV64906.1 hypothetical protein C7443_102560 [Plasticicumulans acidivorans]